MPEWLKLTYSNLEIQFFPEEDPRNPAFCGEGKGQGTKTGGGKGEGKGKRRGSRKGKERGRDRGTGGKRREGWGREALPKQKFTTTPLTAVHCPVYEASFWTSQSRMKGFL